MAWPRRNSTAPGLAAVASQPGGEAPRLLLARTTRTSRIPRKPPIDIIAGKGQELICSTCHDACGIAEAEILVGARRSTMDELAAATIAADKILVF